MTVDLLAEGNFPKMESVKFCHLPIGFPKPGWPARQMRDLLASCEDRGIEFQVVAPKGRHYQHW